MRIFLKILVILIFSSCSEEQNKNEYDFNKIEQIYIQNRSLHRFGGSKDNYINNKKLIKEICLILNSESKFSHYQTRPFNGTLLINFLDDEKLILIILLVLAFIIVASLQSDSFVFGFKYNTCKFLF